MSEISSNSKSPRGLFQIRKKKKKIASKKILDQTFKNNEEQIMMELLRLSQKRENDTKNLYVNKRNKYKMYTSEMKQKFIEIAKMTTPSLVAKSFNIPIKSLKRWLRHGSERKKGGGRKTQDPEMEMKLIEWYHDYHIEKNFPITAKLIKKKALEFSLCKDFAASKGWLEKFKKKYNLEIVRETYLRKINH